MTIGGPFMHGWMCLLTCIRRAWMPPSGNGRPRQAPSRVQIQLKKRWDDRRWDAKLLAIGRDPDIALLTGKQSKAEQGKCYFDTDGASLARRSGGQPAPWLRSLACLAEQHLQIACPPSSVPSQLYLKISAISFLLQSRTRDSGRAQHLPPLASCPLRATL